MSSIERHEWSIDCDSCGIEVGKWADELDVVVDYAVREGWQLGSDMDWRLGSDIDIKLDWCPKCLKEKEK